MKRSLLELAKLNALGHGSLKLCSALLWSWSDLETIKARRKTTMEGRNPTLRQKKKKKSSSSHHSLLSHSNPRISL
jgi:hypothetical protein